MFGPVAAVVESVVVDDAPPFETSTPPWVDGVVVPELTIEFVPEFVELDAPDAAEFELAGTDDRATRSEPPLDVITTARHASSVSTLARISMPPDRKCHQRSVTMPGAGPG